MAVAEIIISCLSVATVLACCVTCFTLFVYRKTSSRIRRAGRGRAPKQVHQLPAKAGAPPVENTMKRAREATEGDSVRKINGLISVLEPTRRPNGLRIDTNKVCPAQTAIAMDTDYSADSFLTSMSKESANRKRLLQDEFVVLSRTEARRVTRSTDRATKHATANRYTDIVPYDHTLVQLGDDGDYINASHVQGESDASRWIATQAPIDAEEATVGKETVSDFWRMVVQYSVECVVMLGQHHEKYVQKCGKYWPSSLGQTERYGSVEVKVVCELEEKSWVHREFDVSLVSGAAHVKVSHWQYKGWNDNDVPDIPSFLEFLLQVRARHYTSPVVVHCSAGIGRTGVFICTDNVISRFEKEGIIDIFSEVNRSRQQRPSMVYTLTQYECIYDTIGEYLRQLQKK